MSHYYGVQRSDAYLMHYGVLGMKWGVRRALKNKDTKSLEKQYNKAIKKLTKLSLLSNRKVQHDYNNSLRVMDNGEMLTDSINNSAKGGALISKVDNWQADKTRKKMNKWAKAVNGAFEKTSYGGNKGRNQRSKISALADQADVRAYAKKQRDAKTRNYMTTGIDDLYMDINVHRSLGGAPMFDQTHVQMKKKKKT